MDRVMSVSLWCEEVENDQSQDRGQTEGPATSGGPSQLRAAWDPTVSGHRVIQRLLRVEERYTPSMLYIGLIQRDPERREELAKWALEVRNSLVLQLPAMLDELCRRGSCDADVLSLLSPGVLRVRLRRGGVSSVRLSDGQVPVCLFVSACLAVLPGRWLHPHRLQAHGVRRRRRRHSLRRGRVQLPAFDPAGESVPWCRPGYLTIKAVVLDEDTFKDYNSGPPRLTQNNPTRAFGVISSCGPLMPSLTSVTLQRHLVKSD